MVREGNARNFGACSRRSLLPRDHALYGQILFPVVTALGAARFTASAIGIAIAAVAAFCACEPALILLGHRGSRALDEHGDRAWHRLPWLVALAGGAGGIGIALMPIELQISLAFPVTLTALVSMLIAWGREKTWGGATGTASTLASAAVPIMLAGGATLADAFSVWLAWSVVFAAVSASIRSAHTVPHGLKELRTTVPVLGTRVTPRA
jgi:hypothetical protein